MIVCPNCSHPNPEGAQACEACYTPLPTSTSTCPNCGASVLPDAGFCGQCGTNLHPQGNAYGSSGNSTAPAQIAATAVEAHNIPPTIQAGIPESESSPSRPPAVATEVMGAGNHPSSYDPTPSPPTALSTPNEAPAMAGGVSPVASTPSPQPIQQPPEPGVAIAKTQLQQQTARLLHVQTDTLIELLPNLPVIHLGKPNDRVPPDIDVAGFPHSEVVSRIHADIRVEGDSYYIEDMKSSNGTYINNLPLLPGNRHRLRPGDRIALGKGDLVTFLFQIS